MGGRGSSYQAAPPIPPVPPAPPPPPTPQASPSGRTQADLQTMSDQELHDFLIAADKIDIPDFLNSDTHLQKMTYALGLNDPPTIVSDAQLQQLIRNGATPIYRTVNDTKIHGVPFTSKDICDMMLEGDLTYHGNGIHGDGLYFSNSFSGSRSYGYGNYKTMTGVLNSNARIVSETKLRSEYDAFVKSHPATRRALGFAKSRSSHDSMSQFALIRGYNVIVSNVGGGENYYTVLDRRALTMTKTLK
jgi:hypothetical protein